MDTEGQAADSPSLYSFLPTLHMTHTHAWKHTGPYTRNRKTKLQRYDQPICLNDNKFVTCHMLHTCISSFINTLIKLSKHQKDLVEIL